MAKKDLDTNRTALDGNDIDLVHDIEEDGMDVVGGNNRLRSQLAKDYKTAQDTIRYFALDWDEFEDLLFVQGRSPDNARVRLSEGSLSTIVVERAGRVMAQLPAGTVNALGLQNQGKGLLMDLLLEKYIYPNANEQYDLETKLFLWNLYSNVYGSMAMCYDWCDSENYTGPDCWLVPMRNFFPQQGRLSIQSSDFVFISTFVSRETFLEWYEDETPEYDLEAIGQILQESAHGGVKPKARDDYLRTNPMFYLRRRAPFTDTGDIEVVTKYESGAEGRWIDFCPDFGNRVIRNIPNPHKNGRIPVVLKYAIPSLDSIMGLGDMEKGRYIQYAMDTTVNLQIDGQKLRTYPPIKVVNGNVVMPTVRFQPGAKWLVSNANDVSHHQFPDVEDSMNLTYQFLKGALSNVTGNTTTQVSAESSSATQGKTPQAIKAQNQSQSTRDEIDLKFQIKATQELFNGFIDLINNVEHNNPIELYMFGQEIQQIAEGYEDIKDAVKISKDGKTAKITIKPSRIKNEKGFDYIIDPTSTKMKDDAAENKVLTDQWNEFVQNPESFQVLKQNLAMAGKQVDISEWFTEILKTGGIRDWKKIIKPLTQATPPGQQGAPNSPAQGGMQGGAPTPTESIKISDLPPAGAVQMAAQANIQLTPQDFVQQAQQEADLKTQSQIALKKTASPEAPVMAQGPPPIGDPDIAQAHAQIMSKAQQLTQQLGDQNGGQ